MRFTVRAPLPATFEGELSDDAAGIAGSATSAQGEAPFQLKRCGVANVKVPPASTALMPEFAGEWQGGIDVGGKVLRLGLRLASDAGGRAQGTLISLDQGNVEIPVTTVTIAGRQLQVESRAISGKFNGTLGTGAEIDGTWAQGPKSMPLVFKCVAK